MAIMFEDDSAGISDERRKAGFTKLSSLMRSEERYRALIQSSTAIVWRADPEGVLLEGWGTNEYSKPFLATYLGRGWVEAVHPDDRERALAVWGEMQQVAGHWELDCRVRRANGQYEWTHARAYAIKGPDRSVREWVGTLTDMHSKRLSERIAKASDERLYLAIESAAIGIWDHDFATGETWWSDTTLETLGLSRTTPPSFEILLGLAHPDDRPAFELGVTRAFDSFGDGRIAQEFRVLRADDGKERWLASTGRVHFDAQGKPARIIGIIADVTERKRAALRARSAEDRFAQVAAASSNACICIDAGGIVTFWNNTAERMFGYSEREAIGRSIDLIIPEGLRDAHHAGMAKASNDQAYAGRTIELAAKTKNGDELPVEISVSTWMEDGERHFGALVRDISDRKRQREHLFRLAHYDLLTGLANRTLFWERMDERLRLWIPGTILLIDLDHFKDVNDTFGHRAGDEVLEQVARRLNEGREEGWLVARLGGDEFVLFAEGERSEASATSIADELRECMALPFTVGGQRLTLNCSVGVALAPLHGTTTEELMVNADLALYSAKESGRNASRLFLPALRLAAQTKLTLATELRRAHERGEFELHYQPQVDLASGQAIGFEALLRWNHPDRGLLAPGDFISVLNSGPMAEAVGSWILAEAVAQAALLYRSGHRLRMGINLFSAQLKSGLLERTITELLDKAGIPADLLELEITENTILKNDATILDTLTGLRRLGVGIAFDDYGTGYASLSMLKRYPLTRLKIDRSFVQHINEDTQDRAVVQAVLGLGQKFALEVIAEGIETEEQRALLLQMGCTQGQGYLFGRPQPITAHLPSSEDVNAA